MQGADSHVRSKILNASIDLFCRDGFARASMRDIARAAKITPSFTYKHFKNKDDILYTIITKIGSALLANMEAANTSNAPGMDRLSAYITAQLSLIEKRTSEMKIWLNEQHHLSPDLRAMVRAQNRTIYNMYYDQVDEIEQQGLMGDLDKTVVTFSVVAMTNWTFRWFRPEGSLSMEMVAHDIIRLCIGGMLRCPCQREVLGSHERRTFWTRMVAD